jgi:hypothetical protein
MIKASVEYVGFRTGPVRREYTLRSHVGQEIREYTIGIAHGAFTSGRVRFQDGPEICYLKLLRELEANGDAPDAHDFTLSDAELADYVTAHTPAPRRSVAPPPPRPATAVDLASPRRN